MKWIRYGSLEADIIPYKCSKCGEDIVVDWTKECLPTECPGCGEKVIPFNTWGTRAAPEDEWPLLLPPQFEAAFDAVKNERLRQIKKWGVNSDNHPFEWMSILGEEFGELCEAVNETCFKRGTHPERGGQDKIIAEATQVATVAVAIIESAMRQREQIDMPSKKDDPVDTIQNDAYLLSCQCPVCMHSITRGYDEGVAYCEKCGQKLHFPPFAKEEIDNAMFEHEMDSYED